jgi:hypothetical protein
MPTAGKAAGALLFALIGGLSVLMVAPHLPPVLRAPAAPLCGAGLGAVLAWRMTGRREGGLARGVGVAVLWSLGASASAAVAATLDRAIGGRYRDLGAAVEDAGRLTFEMAALLLDPAVAALVLGGGALAGLLADQVARRLP